MSAFDKEQLDALRRQVEEDYRLDLAAIERLHRRFSGAQGAIPAGISNGISNGNYVSASSMPGGNYSSASAAYTSQGSGSNGETRTTVLPPLSTQPDPQDKELSGALRSMFKAGR